MTRRLSPAERLAAADRDATLATITAASTWDRFLVEQAVWMLGIQQDEFSANDMRELLPELGHGYLGAAINALHGARIIQPTGQLVPSTSTATKGHGIHVWQLTPKGRAIAEARRPHADEAAA